MLRLYAQACARTSVLSQVHVSQPCQGQAKELCLGAVRRDQTHWTNWTLWSNVLLTCCSVWVWITATAHQTKRTSCDKYPLLIVFLSASVEPKSSSVHTTKTTAGDQQARTCFACTKTNLSARIYTQSLRSSIFWTHSHERGDYGAGDWLKNRSSMSGFALALLHRWWKESWARRQSSQSTGQSLFWPLDLWKPLPLSHHIHKSKKQHVL